MDLTGRINWDPPGTSQRLPNNGFILLGEDGNHYCAMHRSTIGGSIPTLRIGLAKTPNTITSSRTYSQVRADALTIPGATGNYDPLNVIPVVGTQWVGVIMGGVSGQPNRNHVICPFYKINASGILEYTTGDGFLYDGPLFGMPGAGITGGIWAVLVSGGEVYFGLETGTRRALAHAPYEGSNADLSASSWDLRCTTCPFDDAFMVPYASGNPGQRGMLIDRGSGVIGLLKYLSQSHINTNNAPGTPGGNTSPIIDPLTVPQMFYTEIDTVARTNNGLTNVSSLFGCPFPDEGKKFDGSAGDVLQDGYWDGSICGDEVIIPRNYTDNFDCLGIRRFRFTDASTVEALGLTQHEGFTIASVFTRLSGGSAYRNGSDDELGLMLRDINNFYFNVVDLPIVEEPPPEEPPTIVYPPTTEVETVDELPEVDAVIEVQRWLLRTGHIREWGEIAVDDLRVTIKRGVGDTDFEPKLYVRVNRDNRGFGKWASRGLGKKGDRVMTLYFGGFGTARDWQFEFATTDVCEIELRKAEIMPTQLGF